MKAGIGRLFRYLLKHQGTEASLTVDRDGQAIVRIHYGYKLLGRAQDKVWWYAVSDAVTKAKENTK